MTQDVYVAVAAPDFNVAIVGAIPLVDVIGHFDHPTVQAKPSELFGAAFVYICIDLDQHGMLSQSEGQLPTGEPEFFDLNAQDPRHPSVGLESPPACSDRIAMLHR